MPRKLTIAAGKPQAPVARASSHPTRDRLLQATVELLADHLPQAITTEMVLRKSGISRGSLYHHFHDFSELIELAMVGSFSLSVDKTIDSLVRLVSTAKSRDDLLKGLAATTRKTQGRALKAVRLQRARLIVFTEDNPRLAAAMAREQQRLTEALTDLMRESQARGWMSRKFDPRCAAVLVQAYTLGKIVDDIVPDPMDEDTWNLLIDRVVERVFAA